MGQKGRVALKAVRDANFADNTTGAITPTLLRSYEDDLIDSTSNIIDDGITLLAAEVEISSAEILALFTTAKTLITAPGAGKILDVISVEIFHDFNSVAYATNTQLWIAYNGSGGSPIHSSNIPINNGVDSFDKITFPVISSTSAIRVNTPLKAYVATGNPTAGNGTIKVFIVYRIITI